MPMSPTHSVVFDNDVAAAPIPAAAAPSAVSSAAAMRAVWKKDEAVHACERCSRPFTFYRRRHHCRRCGGIYCADCANEKQAGISGWSSAERVCKICRSMAPATMLAAQPRVRHVIILGSPGVGKSAISQLFAAGASSSESSGAMRQNPSPGAANSTRRLFQHRSGIGFALVLEDTIGQPQVGSFPPALAVVAHAYLLVYSVDDPASLQALRTVRERILDCGGYFQPITVVGTTRGDGRVVPLEEAEAVAKDMRARYVEVALQSRDDVSALFDKVLEDIVARE
jgi:GTPase SAR1 family protein